MNATVAWSYGLLDAEEQRAFRRFGALPGLFPVAAATKVLAGRRGAPTGSDDGLATVARLIDKSLLLRDEYSGRATRSLYYMLETVRAYAALELTTAGEHDDAVEGLVRYSKGEAVLAAEGLIGPGQIEWFDRVREDLETHRAALTWLIRHGRGAEASDVAYALMFFWLIRGHATEGLRWYEQILSLPSLPLAAEIRTLLGAAAAAHTRGELERARMRVTRAIELARGSRDLDAVARGAWTFGHIEHAAGNVDAARDWFTKSRDLFLRLAIPWGIGYASSGLAWVALAAGDDDNAKRLADEAESALQSSGPWFLALGLYIRAVLALRRGKPDEAIALMRHSLTRVQESQDTFAVVYGLVPLAVAAALTGDDVWAARILGARDAISERTGSILVDPLMRDLCDRTERDARARLGSDRWAQAYAAGRTSSIDALIHERPREK